MPELQFTIGGDNGTVFIETWARLLGWSEAEINPDGSPMTAAVYIPTKITNDALTAVWAKVKQDQLNDADADATATANEFIAGVTVTIG